VHNLAAPTAFGLEARAGRCWESSADGSNRQPDFDLSYTRLRQLGSF
jgi:hypothetical protein